MTSKAQIIPGQTYLILTGWSPHRTEARGEARDEGRRGSLASGAQDTARREPHLEPRALRRYKQQCVIVLPEHTVADVKFYLHEKNGPATRLEPY